tara:strand:- start:738 stop:989 length:252 start_codon:yes stop_codon:yes gene_type:complete
MSENKPPTQEQINAGLAQALQKQEKTTNEILEYLKQKQTADPRTNKRRASASTTKTRKNDKRNIRIPKTKTNRRTTTTNRPKR